MVLTVLTLLCYCCVACECVCESLRLSARVVLVAAARIQIEIIQNVHVRTWYSLSTRALLYVEGTARSLHA